MSSDARPRLPRSRSRKAAPVAEAPGNGTARSAQIKAKMIGGLPECAASIPLEPAILPDGIGYRRNPLGMIIGVAVSESGAIAYGPVSLPSVRGGIRSARIVVDFAAEDDDAVCVLTLMWLDRDYKPLGIETPHLACAGKPRFVFVLQPEHLDPVLSLALRVDIGPFATTGSPAGGKPVIIRTARVEVS